jgi:hypothetical protein
MSGDHPGAIPLYILGSAGGLSTLQGLLILPPRAWDQTTHSPIRARRRGTARCARRSAPPGSRIPVSPHIPHQVLTSRRSLAHGNCGTPHTLLGCAAPNGQAYDGNLSVTANVSAPQPPCEIHTLYVWRILQGYLHAPCSVNAWHSRADTAHLQTDGRNRGVPLLERWHMGPQRRAEMPGRHLPTKCLTNCQYPGLPRIYWFASAVEGNLTGRGAQRKTCTAGLSIPNSPSVISGLMGDSAPFTCNQVSTDHTPIHAPLAGICHTFSLIFRMSSPE